MTPVTGEQLLTIAVVVVLAGLSAACLFFPRAVQRLALRLTGSPLSLTPQWARAFVRSSIYVWHLRLIGFLSGAAALGLVFAS
jgi:hypothetical protein